jgi:hypothetical protein
MALCRRLTAALKSNGGARQIDGSFCAGLRRALSTLAPLRALWARTPEQAWARRAVGEEGGDWAGCARALLEHGMPGATVDPENPECVLIAGRRKRFSDEVTDVLLEVRDQP